MQRFLEFTAGAALAALTSVIAPEAFAQGNVGIDHQGDGRCIALAQQNGGDTQVFSRGDGGCIDIGLANTGSIDVFALGREVTGTVRATGTAEAQVFLGMCPPGMHHELLTIGPREGGLAIPRCTY